MKGFPHITKNGRWTTTEDGCWTGGFWIGLLWYAYKFSGDEKYQKLALAWLKRLERRKKDKTFDLGFLFYPSFALGYTITKDEYLKKTSLAAANTLSALFSEKSGFVYNEIIVNDKRTGRTAIDAIMALPLLWWAHKQTCNKKYYDIAYKHSESTIKNFIRSDYSTVHIIDFDPKTGKTIRKTTIQGYSDKSCWSRGQAWAIYGFTLAYGASRDHKFLDVAEKLSNYFVENLPSDFVPYWDFNDPQIPNTVKDSSAAAIACCGLLELSRLSGIRKHKEQAINILHSLSTNYLNENHHGILKHGCYHRPENRGVDESLIWGDYYFVEALTKIEYDG